MELVGPVRLATWGAAKQPAEDEPLAVVCAPRRFGPHVYGTCHNMQKDAGFLYGLPAGTTGLALHNAAGGGVYPFVLMSGVLYGGVMRLGDAWVNVLTAGAGMWVDRCR